MTLSTAVFAIVKDRASGKKGVLGNIISGKERLYTVSFPAEEMITAAKEDEILPTSCILIPEGDLLKTVQPVNNTAKKLLRAIVEASWGETEEDEEEDDTIPLDLKDGNPSSTENAQ